MLGSALRCGTFLSKGTATTQGTNLWWGYSLGVCPKLHHFHHPNHHDAGCGNGIFLPCCRFSSQPVAEARRDRDSENYHEKTALKKKIWKTVKLCSAFFSIKTETETISKHCGHKGGQKHPMLLQKAPKEWLSNAVSLFWFGCFCLGFFLFWFFGRCFGFVCLCFLLVLLQAYFKSH